MKNFKYTLQSIKTKQGFTLIELMVVIAIIAILAAVGITVFSGQQAAGRDAKRRADIDSISNALEANFAAPNYSTVYTTQFAGGATPTDPGGNGGIAYSGILAAPAATYTVCAKLEKANGNYSDAGTTSATGATATYYCKKNQQS